MKAIIYDTETQGLPDWRTPSEDPCQPHIVELAALLVDVDTREVIDQVDAIIKPDGWVIPAEASAIHGITTEQAMDVGRPEREVVEQFVALWRHAGFRVAHNRPFDDRIMRIAINRLLQDEALAEEFKAGKGECTQAMSTPILKLPPTAKMVAARRNHYKSANLTEAYEFFTGRKMQGAHRAMDDVRACLAVYWAIKDGITTARPPQD
jgi:DNA polymerase-3 subunit epsilon